MANDCPRCIVLGVGNPHRGDDGAGPAVARKLWGLAIQDVEVIEHGGEATALVAQMEGAASVFLIDACASGAPPGTVRRFDVSAALVPEEIALRLSTHAFGPATAVELARSLGQLPHRCIIYTIEGASFTPGAPLSPQVAAGVAQVAGRVRAEIADAAGQGAADRATLLTRSRIPAK
jgi:hydrogenase maturation protease